MVKRNSMSSEVKDFCGVYGITEEQFYGVEVCDANMYLEENIPVPDGFSPVVTRNLYVNGKTTIGDNFSPKVGWNLYLDNIISIGKNFTPTVKGSTNLTSLKIVPEGFNPKIGACLYMGNATTLPEDFAPVIGCHLDIKNVKALPKGFNPIVGGTLYLDYLKEIPNDFNLTVGTSLILNFVSKIPVGFCPTVGGSLCLPKVKQIAPDFKPFVGCYLYLNGMTNLPDTFDSKVAYTIFLKNRYIYNHNKYLAKFVSWSNGKYIRVDELFTEVVSHKGNVWKVKRIGDDKEFYLISDGKNAYSHGDTLQEAKEDLLFKTTNRSKDDYKDLTWGSELSYEEAIICYRVITGACSYGTRDYIENRLGDKKTIYTVKEIIERTNGEYGNEIFKDYFKK